MYSSLYICSFDLALVTFCIMLIFMLFACIAFCMLSDLGGNKISYLILSYHFRYIKSGVYRVFAQTCYPDVTNLANQNYCQTMVANIIAQLSTKCDDLHLAKEVLIIIILVSTTDIHNHALSVVAYDCV